MCEKKLKKFSDIQISDTPRIHRERERGDVHNEEYKNKGKR